MKITKPDIAKMEKYENSHPLIRLILSIIKKDSFKADEELWFTLNEDLKKNQIVWYPSSYRDITDIINVNNEIFPEFGNNNPNVFIHSDASEKWLTQFEDSLIDNNIYIIKEVSLEFNNVDIIQNIDLFYISIDGKTNWILYFPLTLNENLLNLFLNYSVEIKYIYSVCDGILDGMGGGFPNAIPTKFYSFFYKALKTNYHISQFHNHNRWSPSVDEYIKSNIEKLLNDIRQENKFDINQIDEVENSFKNPIDVFNRFVNFGNCRELWLRICNQENNF
jgi:hypothetical protein